MGSFSILETIWWLLWFYEGLRNGLAVFLLQDNAGLAALHLQPSPVLFGAVDLVTISLLGTGALLATGKLFPLRPRGLGVLVLLFNAANVASVIGSPVPFENPLRIYGQIIATLMLSMTPLIVAERRDGRALLYTMGRAFVLGTVITVLAPLIDGGLHGFGTSRYGIDEVIDPNTVGFHAALALIFTLAWLRGGLSGGLDWLLALVFGGALMLTFSKTSLIAAAAAVGLLWLLSRAGERPGQKVAQAIAVLIPLVVLWHRLAGETATYVDQADVFHTLSGRTPLWQVVLGLSEQHPWLGYGFATFREVLRPYSAMWGIEIVHAHNAYLTALLQTGYVGAALALLIALAVLRQAIRFVRHRDDGAVRVWIALVALVMIRSLTEGSFGGGGFEFALVTALGVLGERMAAEPAAPAPSDAAPVTGAPPARLLQGEGT